MLKKDIALTFLAIEKMIKGIDVSKMSKEDLKNVVGLPSTFAIKMTDELVKSLDEYMNCIEREDRKISIEDATMCTTETVEVPLDMFKSTVQVLVESGVISVEDLNESMLTNEQIKQLDGDFDYTKGFDCDIKKEMTINNLDKEVRTFLALFEYPEKVTKKIYKSYKENHKFVLTDFKDFEVVDNRIYIPLSPRDKKRMEEWFYRADVEMNDTVKSINGFVISKNFIDYLYCSYGNSFQSCYSLNSEYKCFYGYAPTVTAPESFICYATSGTVNKTSVISGCKFHSPNMVWRAWGYADDEGHLLIDKKYRSGSRTVDTCIEFFCYWLAWKFDVICDSKGDCEVRRLYNEGKGFVSAIRSVKAKTYLDSIVINRNKAAFHYNHGSNFIYNTDTAHLPAYFETRRSYDFLAYFKTVTSVEDLDLDKPYRVVDGVLKNVKECPTTGLLISCTEDKSPYSKYFSAPVKSTVVLTFIDGYWCCETIKGYDYTTENGRLLFLSEINDCVSEYSYAFTRSFNHKSFSLKSCKEFLKGLMNGAPEDANLPNAILLRVIEKDKVTCQVFKRKVGNEGSN